MGASLDVATTDKLGRRSGPRRKYTIAEKRLMVEETHVAGASVPEVAHRHAVNANLLSVWRRLYKQGSLREEAISDGVDLLPVKVSTPTLLPTKRSQPTKAAAKQDHTQIEIEFAGGARLRIRHVTRQLLRELITALSVR
jgi:transposase-like protein